MQNQNFPIVLSTVDCLILEAVLTKVITNAREDLDTLAGTLAAIPLSVHIDDLAVLKSTISETIPEEMRIRSTDMTEFLQKIEELKHELVD